jgi:hypothetical protein
MALGINVAFSENAILRIFQTQEAGMKASAA